MDDRKRQHDPESRRIQLAGLPFGVQARVVSVDGTSGVARRLMEMGLVPGAPVCIVKAAPLGDPLQVRVRGYHLALRRAEADSITVDTALDPSAAVLV
jgi:Fe2+ transport system protein FeoA